MSESTAYPWVVESQTGLEWVRRHRGLLALGALLVAALLIPLWPARNQPQVDLAADETPLFI